MNLSLEHEGRPQDLPESAIANKAEAFVEDLAAESAVIQRKKMKVLFTGNLCVSKMGSFVVSQIEVF